MKAPQISVIIPVYNCEKYLRQCLDSVVNQSFKDIEIICVNDGSTDSSEAILKEYKNSDERFKIICQSNGGAGKARNTGLKAAKGKYLSFLDSDDYFEENMLELAYREICDKKASFVVYRSDAFEVDGDFIPMPWTIHMDKIDQEEPITFRSAECNCFKALMGWAWDKLYDAEFIRRNDLVFQELRTTNDMCFVFSALLLADRYSIIDQILAHHRRNVQSSLSQTREKSWHCFHDALIELRRHAISYGMYSSVEHDYINYCLHAALWNLKTLKGDAKYRLYRKLKSEWFNEFGISGKPDSFFTDKGELQMLREIEVSSVIHYYGKQFLKEQVGKIKKKIKRQQ